MPVYSYTLALKQWLYGYPYVRAKAYTIQDLYRYLERWGGRSEALEVCVYNE